MKERILIVEDDKHISKLVKFNLEKASYQISLQPYSKSTATPPNPEAAQEPIELQQLQLAS